MGVNVHKLAKERLHYRKIPHENCFACRDCDHIIKNLYDPQSNKLQCIIIGISVDPNSDIEPDMICDNIEPRKKGDK
jgi:hypothetical protein